MKETMNNIGKKNSLALKASLWCAGLVGIYMLMKIAFFGAVLFVSSSCGTKDSISPSSSASCQLMTRVIQFRISMDKVVDSAFSGLGLSQFSDVDVQVRIEGIEGNVVNGKLSGRAATGRVVKRFAQVDLTCAVNTLALTQPYGHALCRLDFEKVPANPNASDYFERTGLQPSWTFGADAKGWTDPDILVLDRPLKWYNGQAR